MIYALLPERCIIRVYHGALDLRAGNYRRDEGDDRLREMEDLICVATDRVRPRRIYRMPWLNAVDFELESEQFAKASVAARIAYRSEAIWLREAQI